MFYDCKKCGAQLQATSFEGMKAAKEAHEATHEADVATAEEAAGKMKSLMEHNKALTDYVRACSELAVGYSVPQEMIDMAKLLIA